MKRLCQPALVGLLPLLAVMPAFAQCPTGTLYPGALDTNSSLTIAKNNIVTTLTVQQQVADTVLIVTSTTGWAANMMATVDTGAAIEYEFVNSVTGMNTLNVSRACEGSTAVIHLVGVSVANVATAYSGHTSVAGASIAVETALGANLSNVPGTSSGPVVPVNKGGSGVTAAQGNGTKVQLSTGTTTSQDCVKYDANGNTVDAGAPCNNLPTGTQLQYLRVPPNTGTTTPVFSAIPAVYYQSDYNFPAQTPGGSLSIGSNTITMTPCPLGVNGGSDQGHSFYIQGGVGTAEAVLMTGGTCTSGLSTGTVVVTTANTHSGAWTIQSNSGGIQEAIIVAENALGGIVQITTTTNVFAPITIQTSPNFISLTIQAMGRGESPYIVRGASFTAGDIFSYNQTSGAVMLTLRDMTIANGGPFGSFINNTSGAAIHILRAGNLPLTLTNILTLDGFTGIDLDGVQNVSVVNVTHLEDASYGASFAALTGLRIHNTVGAIVTNDQITDLRVIGSSTGAVTAFPLGSCVLIEYTDGMQINGLDCGGATNGIKFLGANSSVQAIIQITNALIDVCQSHCIYFTGTGTPTLTSTFEISNSWISTEYNINTAYNGAGIFIDNASFLNKLFVSGCHIAGNGLGGIIVNGGANVTGEVYVTGSVIRDNNLSNNGTFYPGIEFLGSPTAWSGIHITGNDIYNSLSTSHMTSGVLFSTSATNVEISGNNFCPLTGATSFANGEIVLQAGTYTRTVIKANACVDSQITAIASAATLAFPIYPNFTVTGTTGVTAITTTQLWPGDTGTLITTTGAVTFTAGASIGSTCTTTQNKVYVWMFDGTKVWLNGSGC